MVNATQSNSEHTLGTIWAHSWHTMLTLLARLGHICAHSRHTLNEFEAAPLHFEALTQGRYHFHFYFQRFITCVSLGFNPKNKITDVVIKSFVEDLLRSYHNRS